MREALLLLERRHLINIYPRRGAVVAEMSAQQIKSLFEILALLLTVIARRAADSWRQTDVEGFTSLLDHLQGLAVKVILKVFMKAHLPFFAWVIVLP